MHADTPVGAYLATLPEERRAALELLRKLILKNLPKGYKEGMQYGMVSYHIPLSSYPHTYNNKPLGYIAMASQKNYMSLYLMSVYGDNEDLFRSEYKKTGKRLDMGKSCVRFRRFDDLPVELIAKTVAAYTPKQFIARYESDRS
jgi:hypothetical protein